MQPCRFPTGRIPELCQEALSQGALLTREDLAYRVFFVSPRTITRDLSMLRRNNPDAVIPLRSTVRDIGPVLTHRTKVVRLALEGKTMSEICQIMHHSPRAVSNYLSTFIRCVQLAHKKMQAGQIAFLLRRGKRLIQQYLDILTECQSDAGGGLSHKWIICYKRYVEGKSPDLIARETYHSLTAVDRYLGQFDRVRHCRQQGLSEA